MRSLMILAPAILGAAAVAGFAACSASSSDAPTGNAAQASSVTPIVLRSTETCPSRGYVVACRVTSPTETSCGTTVTLSNRTSSSFDWSATVPIDAVLVTGAQAPSENLYQYSPGSTGDTDLGPPGGLSVSRIDFCVKAGAGAGQDAAAQDAAHEAGLDAGQVEDAGEAVDAGQPSGKAW